MPSGVLQASLAYAMWGLLPLYFHLMAAVAPLDIVLYRALWSLAFVLVLLAVLRRWGWLREVARRPRTLGTFALSALLLSVNWLVYVWAVNDGRVVESSLGYFITPLVNVLLGYFVLHERPRRTQWCALAIAGAVAGQKYNVLGSFEGFPRIPVDEGDLATGGIIALVATFVVALIGAIVGGIMGVRYHRKVDRAGDESLA